MVYRIRSSSSLCSSGSDVTVQSPSTKEKQDFLPLPPDTPTRMRRCSRCTQLLAFSRRKPAVLALVFLALLSILTVTHTFIPAEIVIYSVQRGSGEVSRKFAKHLLQDTLKLNHHRIHHSSGHQISLTPSEELAALVQFITVQATNSLPPHIDPSKPVDPVLICGFDTQSPRAREELDEVIDDVWSANPVILFKTHRNPAGKEISSLLDSLALTPKPVIIDVDQRSDHAVLPQIVMRLTESAALPVLLIGGEPILSGQEGLGFETQEGVAERAKAMLEEGKMDDILRAAGVKIGA